MTELKEWYPTRIAVTRSDGYLTDPESRSIEVTDVDLDGDEVDEEAILRLVMNVMGWSEVKIDAGWWPDGIGIELPNGETWTVFADDPVWLADEETGDESVWRTFSADLAYAVFLKQKEEGFLDEHGEAIPLF